ncbi:ABC transporter permease [Agrobacterium tumefaciens]|uniref:ABC transporter permease n=1 Tax=Agrobacterium tumefaciens TaxID=358 RepID=UPI001571DE86|nr:ABC transporter permease [Agrobacterium tumefaciens]NTE68237.1 ABC transporter permease [Agrobacterium tumefaciens]
MTQMWWRKLTRLVVTLLVCSFAIYGSIDLAPGDTVTAITGGRPVSASVRKELTEYHHLNDPFLVRYASWLGRAVRGDLGQSVVSRRPAAELLLSRLPATMALVGYASLLIIFIGVPLGAFAAGHGGGTDTMVVVTTGAVAAIPAFVASAALLALLAVKLRIFPSFGTGKGFVDGIYHLTLPAVALALPACGYVARVTRSAVLAESAREYVQAAYSRGLSRGYVLRVHVMRNALLPITTTVGITITALIAGSVVVEQIFSISGIGRLLVQSVAAKDVAVVQAVSMFMVTSFVVLNAAVDALYPILDPRIGRGTSA